MLVLVSADAIGWLPVFQVDEGRPSFCEGWRVLAGLTASVVDGPDDRGFFVEGVARPEEVEGRVAWLEAVERAGGAVVLVVDSHVAVDDWTGGQARGGFVRAVDRTG